MDEQRKKVFDDIVQNEFPEFIQMLERNLDFTRWRFIRVFSGIGQFSPIVIYASVACRVMFTWRTLDHLHDETPTMDVRYGRLHAPNNEEIITWNGQKCYCWHGDMRKPLYFLDGLSPDEAASKSSQFLWPEIMQEFRKSSVGKSWTQQEYTAKMHAAIWQYYGQRMFDLFDLHQPSLWKQYSQFVAEYQRLTQEFSLSGHPTPDKIC